MPQDAAFWRDLRQDFESLQGHGFQLTWYTRPPLGPWGKSLGDSQWAWSGSSPKGSLRARLSAFAMRGAKALGFASEEAWYDELRKSDFVQFKLCGSARQFKRSDGFTASGSGPHDQDWTSGPGEWLDWDFGTINDVVKESVTLCCKLESDAEFQTAAPSRRSEAESSPKTQPRGPGDSEAFALLDPKNSTQQIVEAAMVNPFSEGANRHPELIAHWDSRQKLWRFHKQVLDKGGKPMPGTSPEPPDPQSSDRFAQAVRLAFGSLRNSRDPNIRILADTLREPCQVWLDLMRNERRGFERVVQIRTDHWSTFVRAQEAEVPMPPSATVLLDDGDIRGVFVQSANFWDDIAARGFALEAQGPMPSGTADNLTVEEKSVPKLNGALIKAWMDKEGWENKTLAKELHITERVVSSMRNNGRYHGTDAVTKLANLMGRDPLDLYLP